LIVLTYTAVVSLFASLFWNEIHGRLAAEQRMAHRQTAQYAAEAGIEKAFAVLANGGAYVGEMTTIGDGGFRTEVQTLEDGHVLIVSAGEAPLESPAAQRVTLQAEIRLRPSAIVRWEVLRP
jgi:type II secretory pathway component PulK